MERLRTKGELVFFFRFRGGHTSARVAGKRADAAIALPFFFFFSSKHRPAKRTCTIRAHSKKTRPTTPHSLHTHAPCVPPPCSLLVAKPRFLISNPLSKRERERNHRFPPWVYSLFPFFPRAPRAPRPARPCAFPRPPCPRALLSLAWACFRAPVFERSGGAKKRLPPQNLLLSLLSSPGTRKRPFFVCENERAPRFFPVLEVGRTPAKSRHAAEVARRSRRRWRRWRSKKRKRHRRQQRRCEAERRPSRGTALPRRRFSPGGPPPSKLPRSRDGRR